MDSNLLLSIFYATLIAMNRWLKLLLVMYGCFLCLKPHAQTDTAFWFVAPEVTYNGGNIHGDRPIYLRITALNTDAVVTITQPANSFFAPITVNVPANTSQSYDLTANIEMVENKPADQVLNYGLLIRSTAFVTIYYEEASVNNPEIFALKGRNALGNSFFIPAQNIMTNNTSFSPKPSSAFDIVATEDATTITITPANDIVGHAAGIPFTVLLNKGQTYSATAVAATVAAHLMGSTVTADKPIAITIKDDSIGGGGYGGCFDLAGDQIIPLALVGTKYITLPGYLNNPSTQPTDQVFILATQNNTTVTINGILVATLGIGQTYRQGSYNEVFYIETSKPVYVLHLSGFGCEVGHAMLPQLDCSGSRTVGFTRSVTSPLYVNILVKSGGEGDFSFNGGTGIINASQFLDVPFSGGQWKYARIQLSTSQMPAGTAAIVKNSSQDFHLSIIHGDAATGCRYGYFSGFNRFDATSFSNTSNNKPACSGDTLKLFCDVGATEGILFSWTGPNGFVSTDQNPVIPNVQTSHAGTYTVVASKPGCNTITLTTVVNVNQTPDAFASSISPVCEGTNVQLNGSSTFSGVSYSWSGPALGNWQLYTSTQQNPVLTSVGQYSMGNYILTVTKNGCTAKDTVGLVVNYIPPFLASASSPVCEGDNIQLSYIVAAIWSNGESYSWTGPNGFTANVLLASVPSATLASAGVYTLVGSAPACPTKTSTANVVVTPKPVVNIVGNNSVCTNETLQLSVPGLFTVPYKWTGPNGYTSNQQNIAIANPALNAAGNYTFTAGNIGCTASATSNVTVKETPSAQLQAILPICRFDTLRITNNNTLANSNYSWVGPHSYTGSQQNIVRNNYNYTDTGKYYLTVTANGCISIDSINATLKESPIVQFAALTNICEEASGFLLNASETTGIAGNGNYTMDGTTASAFFNPLAAGKGTHLLRYTYNANNGCTAFKEQPIEVYATPIVDAGSNKTILNGSGILLNASLIGTPASIVWTPIIGLDNATLLTPFAKPIQTTTYKLEVTSTDGCYGYDTVNVKVLNGIKIPNVFSPNGDGINDKWFIEGLNDMPNCDVEIFDRSGRAVFKSKGYSTSWDGTFNGKPLPVANYYYIIRLNDGFRAEPFSGSVLLLR